MNNLEAVRYVNMFTEIFGRHYEFYCVECHIDFDCQYNLNQHNDICHPYGKGLHDTRNTIEVPKLVFNMKGLKKWKT